MNAPFRAVSCKSKTMFLTDCSNLYCGCGHCRAARLPTRALRAQSPAHAMIPHAGIEMQTEQAAGRRDTPVSISVKIDERTVSDAPTQLGDLSSRSDEQELGEHVPQCKFLRLVQKHAQERKNANFCVWLEETLEQSDARSFGDLWHRAGAVAHMLAKEGVENGDRVVLCFNFGLQFLDAFMGCLRLGAVAVPVYPPNPAKLQEALKKLALVSGDCNAKVCLLDLAVERLRTATKGWPTGMVYRVPKVGRKELAEQTQKLDMRRDEDVAFLQYTSGSTGEPKGVMLTFGNIYHNMHLSDAIAPHANTEDAVGCSWLPQFHDMGLLFCTLYPLARGRKQVFMSPSVFIKHPVLWLQAMSKYRCTWTTVPNFAYGLCARKYAETQPDKRPVLDLSHVVALGNAAEPVRLKTMREFVDAFSDSGISHRACFFPSYGLAEHTVTATTGEYSIRDDPSLDGMTDESGKFVFSGFVGAEEDGKQLVDLRIVADGEEVEDGRVGEIWLRSASKGVGYWGMEQRSEEAFRASLSTPRTPLLPLDGVDASQPPTFLRTGDEGFVEVDARSGRRRLFVCGRQKDVIIIRGKNLYPQDVELSAEQAAQGKLRLNCSAAFQSQQAGAELEAADLVCELKGVGMSEGALAKLCEAMVGGIRAEHSLRLRRLVLIRPRSIPKTTSGKIRRKETRRALEEGDLMRKALMVWEDVSIEAKREEKAPPPAVETLEPIADKSFEACVNVVLEEVCLATGLEREEVEAADGGLTSIGLESITAHSLTHRLSIRLGIEVGIDDVISASSVQTLAAALQSKANRPPSTTHSTDGEGPLVAPLDGTDAPEDKGSWRSAWTSGLGFSFGRLSSTFRSDRDTSLRSFRQAARERQARLSTVSFNSSTLSQSSFGEGSLDLDLNAQLDPASEAGCWSVAARLLVQLILIFWVLLSVYLCAVPAVAVMERITDIQIFPLFLFRWLMEPTASQEARFQPWGDGNDFGVFNFPAPNKPLISQVYLAVPIALISAAGTFLACFSIYSVLLKWLLLGRVQAGDYTMWGFFYWRRWLVQKHIELLALPLSLVFQDAAPLSLLYLLLGASIGRRSDAILHAGADIDYDLVQVGERAVVSPSATLLTGVVSGGMLHLRQVQVGDAADVSDACVLCPGVRLPACTKLQPQSLVTADVAAAAAPGATMGGVPASVLADETTFRGCQGATSFKLLVMPAAWLLCLLVQASCCVMPLVAVHEVWLAGVELSGLALVAVAVLDLALYLLGLCVFTLGAKWLLLGRSLSKGSRIRQGSTREVARECVHRLQALVSRFVLSHLWGGVCIKWWYQAMGAKIGSGTIFSMGVGLTDWDSVEIGPVCLLGGGSMLQTSAVCPDTGDRVIQGLQMGEGVTVGTNALVGAGSVLGKRSLVGMLSYLPPGSEVAEHTVVMGTKSKTKSKRCYVPKDGVPWSPPLVKEAVICAVYAAWTVAAVWAALYACWWLRVEGDLPALLLFPLGAGLYQLGQLLLVVVHKRTGGRVRRLAGTKADRELEFSSFRQWVWLYWHMFLYHAYDLSLLGGLMRGGPLANLWLKSLGARVHWDAVVNCSWVFDCEQLDIGAGAALNALVTLSPHVIAGCASARLQRITVAPRATVWPRAILLGETLLPSLCQLGPLSRMVPASSSLAMEELERSVSLGVRMDKMLAGVPAKYHVTDGLQSLSADADVSTHASFLWQHRDSAERLV